MQNVSNSYDAHDAAGRAMSIMSLLVPDLRKFVKRCVFKHVPAEVIEAATATASKKKKKSTTVPTDDMATVSSVASGSAELDFAASLKFIEQHWTLFFENDAGMYASDLRNAVAKALQCRNKIAHQAAVSSATSSEFSEALSDLAVFVGAEQATKQKIRDLLSPTSARGDVEALQQSFDVFAAAQLKRAEETLAPLASIQDTLEMQMEKLEEEAERSNWLIQDVKIQRTQQEDDSSQLTDILETLEDAARSSGILLDQVTRLTGTLSLKESWKQPRSVLDSILERVRDQVNHGHQEALLNSLERLVIKQEAPLRVLVQ